MRPAERIVLGRRDGDRRERTRRRDATALDALIPIGAGPWLAPVVMAACGCVSLCIAVLPQPGSAVHLWEGTALGAIILLLLCHGLPRLRAFSQRHKYRLLAAQAVLALLPLFLTRPPWTTMFVYLGAGVLLTVNGRTKWLLFAALVAARVIIVHETTHDLSHSIGLGITVVDMGLALYGIFRLISQVDHLRATQADVRRLAAHHERQRAARELDRAVTVRLSAIAPLVQAARQATGDPIEQAKTSLERALSLAKAALTDVRTVFHSHTDAPEPPGADLPHGISARAATAILIAILCLMASTTLLDVGTELGHGLGPVFVPALASIVGLQLRHSALRGDLRPAGWKWTLTAEAVLTYVPVHFMPYGWLDATQAFPASVLLVVGGRAGWFGYGAAVASVVPIGVAYSLPPTMIVGWVANDAGTGLILFALARLPRIVRVLQAARAELAAMAVAGERLRVNRDVHDLLATNLTAIVLLCELVMRQRADDPTRASNAHQLTILARRTLTEARAIPTAARSGSLLSEADVARTILSASGIEARIEICDVPADAAADSLLATVLRETVTNILRHSFARTCTICASARDSTVLLSVVNDGVPRHARQPTGIGGNGLVNLRARIEEYGGNLTFSADDTRFWFLAEIPAKVAELSPPERSR